MSSINNESNYILKKNEYSDQNKGKNWIDTRTKVNSQDYSVSTGANADNLDPSVEHPSIYSGSILDGLSDEARGYVEQAIARTQEVGYSIFEDGLMPENLEKFGILEGELEEIEPGVWQTADGRIRITSDENSECSPYIIEYDSDGKMGFDRTAAYEYVEGYGYKKVQEDFNAADVGAYAINELSLTKNYEITENKELVTETIKNPDKYKNKLWFLNPLNWFKPDTVETSSWETTGHTLNTNVSIGVNTDDLGIDETNGNHYDYVEYASYIAESEGKYGEAFNITSSDHFQADIKWNNDNTYQVNERSSNGDVDDGVLGDLYAQLDEATDSIQREKIEAKIEAYKNKELDALYEKLSETTDNDAREAIKAEITAYLKSLV